MSFDPVARGMALKTLPLAKAGNAVSATLAQNVATNARDATPFPVTLTDPSRIASLKAWYDAQQPVYTASYAAVCTTLGDQVAIFPDQSGNAAALAGSATKPTYHPTGINGHPAINFSGNSYMTVAGVLTAAFDTAFTLIAVASSGTLTDLRMIAGSSSAYISRTGGTSVVSSAAPNLTVQPLSMVIPNLSGIACFSYDGANITYMDDSVMGGLGGSVASSKRASTGNLGLNGQTFAIGGSSAGTFLWPGMIGEVLLYAAALTDDQIRQVYAYLAAKWGYNAKPLVMCTGDSLTSGTASTGGPNQNLSISGTNYPSQMYAILGAANVDVRTDAYPGRTIATVVSQSPAFSDMMNFPQARRMINVVWIATNTLTGTLSRMTTYREYVKLCLIKKALGQRVVAATILPRQDSVYAGFEADRLAVNALIRANYRSFADGLADIGAIALLQNPLNTTYFDADKVHLKDAGYALVAPVVAAAVTPLLT